MVTTFYLYDITHLIKIKLQYDVDRGVHKVYLPEANAGQRKLVLQNESELKEVSEVKQTNFINYSDQINQGDYIIITHPSLTGKDNAVDNYTNYRSSIEGGNYNPVVINVEDLYDQYSYGIRKHPLAIKYFLNEAIENWDNTPTHCLLLGKAIKNSKCRTTPFNWAKNLVPSFGDSPNDQYFGAKDFTPLSRLAIGRLSIDNEQAIQHYLNKVIAVEENNITDACKYIEEAQWKHQMFHISGGQEGKQSELFAERLRHQANIAQNGELTANTKFLLKSEQDLSSNECLISNYYDAPIVLPSEECIGNILNNGSRIMNFLGHSSGLLWEVDVNPPEDYTYNEKYPIIISQSNFNSDVYKSFADNNQLSMPEAWLNANESGATAFIGFYFIYDMLYAADIIDGLYDEIFKFKPNATLGEQINATIHKHYDADDIITKHAVDHLIFSGDPALKYYLNTKPEVAITEDNIDLTVNPISDFYYSVDLVFDFNSLNIAAIDSIPYNILLIAGETETEVSSHWLKPGEQGFFKGEFTLQPNQSHLFQIQLDATNQFDEICEYNNIYKFRAGEWVGINNDLLAGNTISNHPNPFSEQTTFDITLSQTVVQQDNYLNISNLNGQLVHQIKLDKGLAEQVLSWNGTDVKGNLLPAGVYWYQLKSDDSQIMSLPKKVVLVR